MTSISMKQAAKEAWAIVEQSMCPEKNKQSHAKTAKERIVRHHIASNFAYQIESKVVRRRGRGGSRLYVYRLAPQQHLASHEIVGYCDGKYSRKERYEIFVRISEGSTDNADRWDSAEADEFLLSQGFDSNTWGNVFNWTDTMNYETGDNITVQLGIGLNSHDHIWTHKPSDFCSYNQQTISNPDFEDFFDDVRFLLLTVVAVHIDTNEAYLLASTWGFEKDKGWELPYYYGFGGTVMRTNRGSEETCQLKLLANTGEEDEEDEGNIRLDLEYRCPRRELMRVRNDDGKLAFRKKKRTDLRINSECTSNGLDDEFDSDDDIPLHHGWEPDGEPFTDGSFVRG